MKIKYIGDMSPVKVNVCRDITWETDKVQEVNEEIGKYLLERLPDKFKKSYSRKEKTEVNNG